MEFDILKTAAAFCFSSACVLYCYYKITQGADSYVIC